MRRQFADKGAPSLRLIAYERKVGVEAANDYPGIRLLARLRQGQ